MPKTNVVRSPAPHRHIPGGDRMDPRYAPKYHGNALVKIDTSYIDQLTPEQEEQVHIDVATASWPIIEESIASGEEV